MDIFENLKDRAKEIAIETIIAKAAPDLMVAVAAISERQAEIRNYFAAVDGNTVIVGQRLAALEARTAAIETALASILQLLKEEKSDHVRNSAGIHDRIISGLPDAKRGDTGRPERFAVG